MFVCAHFPSIVNISGKLKINISSWHTTLAPYLLDFSRRPDSDQLRLHIIRDCISHLVELGLSNLLQSFQLDALFGFTLLKFEFGDFITTSIVDYHFDFCTLDFSYSVVDLGLLT